MLRSSREILVCAQVVLLSACSSQAAPVTQAAPASTEQSASAAPVTPATPATPMMPAAPAGAAPAPAAGTRASGPEPAAGTSAASAGMRANEATPTAAGTGGIGAPGEGAAGMVASASPLCAAMVASANDFIAALDTDALKTAALHPFDEHHKFAYEPQVAERPGASLMMLSDAQQEKALALVRSGLSDHGFEKAETTRALENLKAFTGFQINMRDPEYYWIAVYGEPSETGSWGWQLEGHHLALHFTLKACAIADTPTFMGSWPAEVPSMVAGGPPVGSRNLEQEEELGRVLAKSLDADMTKRAQAFQAAAYRQMLPQGPDKAEPMMPAGLSGSAMSEAELMQLKAIVSSYASVMHPELAAARLQRIEAHGGWENVSFVWTGALEPKQRHFYRIQGQSFFIEYRNDDGDHIHTAWRDFDGDWGDDLP